MKSNEIIGMTALIILSTFLILSVIDTINQTRNNGKE